MMPSFFYGFRGAYLIMSLATIITLVLLTIAILRLTGTY
tara:strand:+ start:101 stop:217 length:117 start_codon:yes stop_codon:yes gene_type:complete